MLHRKPFLGLSQPNSGDRHGVAIVAAGCDAHVVLVGRHAVGDVEADPAEPVDMRLRPGVARRLLGDAVDHQIAADIARGKAEQPRGGDEDLGLVLTRRPRLAPCAMAVLRLAWSRLQPASAPAGAGSRRVSAAGDQRSWIGAISSMQPRDVGALADRGGKRLRRLAGHRQRRLAHEQPERRKAAVEAGHAGLVVGLDLAGRLDADQLRLALDADQPRVVAEMVGKPHLLARAFDRQRPRARPSAWRRCTAPACSRCSA